MCFCDSEQPKLYNETKRIARKTHKCCECGNPINPGETYRYVDGLWDRFQSFKTCMVCVDLESRIYSEVDCACLSFLDLYSDATEYGYLSSVR